MRSALEKRFAANLPSGRYGCIFAVPQTDTGGWVENTKASGRRKLKELGKLAGRNFGRCPPCDYHACMVVAGRSERSSSDCLSKTQVSAKAKANV